MNRVCQACGLTVRQIVGHWKVNRNSNPRACTKVWHDAGYRFNVPSYMLQTKKVTGCLVKDVFELPGDPYHSYDASYNGARAAHAHAAGDDEK